MPTLDDLYTIADNGNRIKRKAFWISSCILFALAILTVFGRVFIKLRHKLRFGVDDYIVFVATACLIAGTGVLYVEVDNLYIGPQLNKHPEFVPLMDPKRLQRIFNLGMRHQHIFFTLLWTSIFAVKFSFLSFFWRMLDRMRAMKIYWWVVFATLIPSWALIIILPIMQCPRFGADAKLCLKDPRTDLYNASMAVSGTLDALTDLMIVSIPILVLRRASLPTRQKAIIGTFLCLSLTMIVMTITRSAKVHGPGGIIDIRWAVYWVHVEACLAVLMVSLTSFRTAFNLSRARAESRDKYKKPSTYMRYGRKTKDSNQEIELTIPRPTMTGMHNYARGLDGRTVAVSYNGSSKSTLLEKGYFNIEETHIENAGRRDDRGTGRPTPASSMEEPHREYSVAHAV